MTTYSTKLKGNDMVKCERCESIFQEEDITKRVSFLGDAPWGKGQSSITEYFCPNCGSDELQDGWTCYNCDEFVPDGTYHSCDDEEDWEWLTT